MPAPFPSLYATFSSRHAILPVIPVANEEQALRATELAREHGADGVFLINHTISDRRLLDIHAEVKEHVRPFFVGVNCLGLRPEQVFAQVGRGAAGVWVDDARINEQDSYRQPVAEAINMARYRHHFDGLYFGGVAYRGQRDVSDVARAARIASFHMDVVTTRGPGKDIEHDLARIAAMKAAIPATPLAIASGITPENVHAFLPHANAFLVGTGIRAKLGKLDPQRLRALVATVRAYKPDSPPADIPMRYEEDLGFGYHHGRELLNPMLDITAHGREALGHALAIAMQQNPHIARYHVDPEHGLVLFSSQPGNDDLETRILPRPLNVSETADFVWDWLQRMPMPRDECDGVPVPGFRVRNGHHGIVDYWWDSIVAIKPIYYYLHK